MVKINDMHAASHLLLGVYFVSAKKPKTKSAA